MVTGKTIVLEDRLAEIFSYIPTLKNDAGIDFTPTFMYGNESHLVDFLRQHKSGVSVYPIIWLVYPLDEKHSRSDVSFSKLTLILAVETNAIMLNNQRLKETYGKVLIPLLDSIRRVLLEANIANIEDEFTTTKFPNYSDDSDNQKSNIATYVWDALRVSFSGKINGNCLKTN